MWIYYRDELGIVQEYVGEEYREIDFCDGFVYFTSSEEDEDGNLIERKIPLSALVRISN